MTDGYDFWQNTAHFRELALTQPENVGITVIGSGGGAATILAWLAGVFGHTRAQIVSISTLGALFPRGDGYGERRWLIDLAGWEEEQNPAFKRDIIKRTDAGVISARLKQEIDQAHINFVSGRVDRIENLASGRFNLLDEADNEIGDATHVVKALGFDAWDLLRLLHGDGGRLDADLHGRLGVWSFTRGMSRAMLKLSWRRCLP